MQRYLQAGAAAVAGSGALAMLWGARYAYGDFLPLHGYEPVHAHVMASQEGFFLGYYAVIGAVAVVAWALVGWRASPWSLSALLGLFSSRSCAGRGVCLLAILAAGGAWAVSRGMLRGAFLTDDEMAMLFQAKVFLEGRLWAEPTPFPDVFHYAMVIESPRWYGIYPPGHPAVLALSVLIFGDERAFLGVFAAGWVLLTYALGRRLYDPATALLGTALLTFSPFFVFSSGTLASEVSSGLLLLAALNFAVRLDSGRWVVPYALGLGLALGAASLVRPYTTVVVALALGVGLGWRWLRGQLAWPVPFLVMGGVLSCVALSLGLQAELTGDPWLTPYEVNFPGRFRLGFGQDAFGVIHSPQLALAVAGLTLFELNAWLLGWPCSLVPVGLGLLSKGARSAGSVVCWIPFCLLVAHLPVPMAGVHDTGPLYYLEMLPLLVLLAARGLVVSVRVARRWWGLEGADLVAWAAVAACLLGGTFFGYHQGQVLRSLAAFNREPYEVAEANITGPAVVFVDDIQTSPPSSWVLGLRPPHPALSDRILYAHVTNLARAAQVMQWVPDRRAYHLSRDSQTGAVSLVPLPRGLAESL